MIEYWRSTMRLAFGAKVHCTDGQFGELADVAIDPQGRRVTHMVVAPHRQHARARLVPVDQASVEDGAIMIACTLHDVKQFPLVEEFAYLRLGERPVDDPRWDVGIETIQVTPEMGWPVTGPEPMAFTQSFGITYDLIPRGEVEIRRASRVTSADGEHLGHVEGLLVDRDGGVSHMLLGRGHLWGRREVAMPLSAITRIEMDAVTVGLTKAEVDALPSSAVHAEQSIGGHRRPYETKA